ncbi:ATP-binding protein [Kitasatospora sp. NBC_00085]|uniref:ATP-binding protein n=1 Tax=unclassified Kitasatospora TaxID=2633591 RepID=UPI003249EEBD
MTVAPTMVRLAARTTRTVLTARGVPAGAAVLDAALLVVTELAANTVRHTRSVRATLAALVAEDHFTIAVRDDDPRVPELPAPDDAPPATGHDRGLAVVAGLAADFDGNLTVIPDRQGPGKTISVLLPLPTAPRP